MGTVRYKDMQLGEDAASKPRYWLADADAFLKNPPPKQEIDFTPKFHV
jgi:hypothetical protein